MIINPSGDTADISPPGLIPRPRSSTEIHPDRPWRTGAKMTTILITEDEQVVAEDLRITLEGFGYAVAGVAATGEAAIQLRRRPGLISC